MLQHSVMHPEVRITLSLIDNAEGAHLKKLVTGVK